MISVIIISTRLLFVACDFQDVILYRAIGEADALDAFYVDPDTGRVTIKKLLYPGFKTTYTVSKYIRN